MPKNEQKTTVVVIELTNENYPVLVGGDDVLLRLNDFITEHYGNSTVFILGDSNTISNCLVKLDWLELSALKDAEVLEVEPGEDSKSIEIYNQLIESMLALQADRNSLIVNLGGGVITDLGGFIASTIKRGIDYINVPTTLLAMVDASIGGKTGINSLEAKNQIGTFYEPKAVFIADVFLETLPEEELRSGLGEMVKHLLISDENAIESLQKLNAPIEASVIANSAKVKLEKVTTDFKEKGARKALNYGHTFGHAVESSLLKRGVKIPHGIAVLIGILLENDLSERIGLLSKEENLAIASWITNHFKLEPFIAEIEREEVLNLLRFDKKNTGDDISFSLIGPIGRCTIDCTPPMSKIEVCLSSFLGAI